MAIKFDYQMIEAPHLELFFSNNSPQKPPFYNKRVKMGRFLRAVPSLGDPISGSNSTEHVILDLPKKFLQKTLKLHCKFVNKIEMSITQSKIVQINTIFAYKASFYMWYW